MRKMAKGAGKWIMAAVLGIVCMMGTVQSSVQAEDVFRVSVDQYAATDGKIEVYVNHNQGKGYVPSIEDCGLLIGKQTVAVESVAAFQNAEEPVSYLLMVDVSGSMDEERVEQAKEVMQQLVKEKGTEDNVNIAVLGNDIESSGFEKDEENILSYIENIKVTTEDTNLYAAIKQELEVLKTDKSVYGKRCLVIFSDGADDQQVGITKEEADTIVKESHIPIFTVAMPNKRLRDSDEESAKILGSFARDSAGGEHFAPLVDESSYEEIADEIKERIDSSLILTADLSEVTVGDDTVYIEATLSKDGQSSKGNITVPSGAIKEQVEVAKQRVTEININVPEKEKPVVEETVEEENDLRPIILVAIAVVIVVLIIVLIITTQRKKQEDEVFETGKDIYLPGNEGNIEISGFQQTDNSSTMAPGAEAQSISLKKYPKKILFVMYRIGPGKEVKYELKVKDEVTIGRNESCTLSLKEDSALSGKHCSVIYRDGKVYVKDNNSTNGTFANGVPIVGELRINQDDILLIGSNEYRVRWE